MKKTLACLALLLPALVLGQAFPPSGGGGLSGGTTNKIPYWTGASSQSATTWTWDNTNGLLYYGTPFISLSSGASTTSSPITIYDLNPKVDSNSGTGVALSARISRDGGTSVSDVVLDLNYDTNIPLASYSNYARDLSAHASILSIDGGFGPSALDLIDVGMQFCPNSACATNQIPADPNGNYSMIHIESPFVKDSLVNNANITGLLIDDPALSTRTGYYPIKFGGKFYLHSSGRVGIGAHEDSTAALYVTGGETVTGAMRGQTYGGYAAAPNTDGITKGIEYISNTSTAYNATPEAGIDFYTKYNVAGDPGHISSIQAGKDNATDGNLSGFIRFITRNGTNFGEAMRLTKDQHLLLGSATDTGNSQVLQVTGTSTFSSDVTTAGKLSIGTATAPPQGTAWLQASNSGGVGGDFWITNSAAVAVNSIARLSFGSDGTTDATPNAAIDSKVTNAGTFVSDLLFKIYDGAALNEKARITSTGNMLIGTSTDDGVNMLQVAGPITSTSTIKSSIAAASNAMTITEGSRIGLDTTGAGYIQARTSNHGIDIVSNGSDDNFILNAPASSNNILRVQKNGTDEFYVDSNGTGKFNNNVTAAGSVRSRTNNPVPSCHVGTGSCASQTEQGLDRGSVALSTGAATVTFPVAYGANPFCFCQDQANTASAITRCNATTTVLTINGTGTDTIAYFCIGNY